MCEICTFYPIIQRRRVENFLSDYSQKQAGIIIIRRKKFVISIHRTAGTIIYFVNTPIHLSICAQKSETLQKLSYFLILGMLYENPIMLLFQFFILPKYFIFPTNECLATGFILSILLEICFEHIYWHREESHVIEIFDVSLQRITMPKINSNVT